MDHPLPIPTMEDAAAFALIYRDTFGIELGEADALEAATAVLQIHYLVTHVEQFPREVRKA